MFGRKKKISEEPVVDVSVVTLPVEFYGGANPVVTFKKVEKQIELKKISAADKQQYDRATAAGSGEPLHPANLFSSRVFLIVGASVFFALAVAGLSVYYWRDAKRQPEQPKTLSSITPEPLATVPVDTNAVSVSTTIAPTPVTAPTSTVELPPSLQEPSIDFPSEFLSDTVDLDKDNLTDAEEELFVTDPAVPDTDADGFTDAHEVFNLYNPTGKEPMKIIDSGLVKEFSNPVYGYSIYYPASWAVGNVDNTYKEILLSTRSGESISIRVIENNRQETFTDWFGQWAKNERYNNLDNFSSVFKETGYHRNDYLVYYFPVGNKVFVISYSALNSTQIQYRTVVKMVARSFRLNEQAGALPPRIEEPGGVTTTPTVLPNPAPTATSTPVL